jgi:hypothetical protein
MLTKTPRQFTKPRKTYKDVLTPTQAEEMERFLIALAKGAKLCRRAGVRPDISAAITAWGYVPKTAEEYAISNAFWKREKKAKMQRKGKA